MLLQSHAHGLMSAACALYAAIEDPEQMPDGLQPEPCSPVEADTHTGDPGYHASASLDALLQNLPQRLAAVSDRIATAGARYRLCSQPPPRADLDALAGVLVAIAQELKAAALLLPDRRNALRLQPIIAGIHALEMRGDRLFRQVTERMQAEEKSEGRSRAQWHGVYEAVAQAIRECGEIAQFIAQTPRRSLH